MRFLFVLYTAKRLFLKGGNKLPCFDPAIKQTGLSAAKLRLQKRQTIAAVFKKKYTAYLMNKKRQVQYAFLDSGIGGLPYMQKLKEMHPEASCAYIADTAHFPYGEKKLQEVIGFASDITQNIIELLSPKVIIIACNTISVSALEHLRKIFAVPFVGTVPAIKPAAALSKNKKIAVLATERTVNDIYTQKLIEQFGSDCSFFMRADSVLVRGIEDYLLTAPEKEKITAISPAMEFFKAAGADTAVLGCTHFLHLRNIFITECAPDIQIIDSLEGVVNRILELSPFNRNQKTTDKNKLYITSPRTAKTANQYSVYASLFNMDLDFLL